MIGNNSRQNLEGNHLFWYLIVLGIGLGFHGFCQTRGDSGGIRDIYGHEIELKKHQDRIIILHLENVDGRTFGRGWITPEAMMGRLEQLASAFNQKELEIFCTVVVAMSRPKDQAGGFLYRNPDIYVNQSDELWNRYLSKAPVPTVPAAVVDLNPDADPNPKSYILFASNNGDSNQEFARRFLPQKGSLMTEKLKAAVKERITEAMGETRTFTHYQSKVEPWLDRFRVLLEVTDHSPEEISAELAGLYENELKTPTHQRITEEMEKAQTFNDYQTRVEPWLGLVRTLLETIGHTPEEISAELANLSQHLKIAIEQRITATIKTADRYVDQQEYNRGRDFYAQSGAWVDHLANSFDTSGSQKFAKYYIELANRYTRLADNASRQRNPQVLNNNPSVVENQDLERCAKCLEKAINLEPDFDGAEAFYGGVISESQGKLEDAKNSYQGARSQNPDWAEVEISLTRVEEKIRQVLLCIQQEVRFSDDLPETEGIPNQLEPLIIEELIRRGYKVRIVPSTQKKEMYELIRENNKNRLPPIDRILNGKITLTLRRFRPLDLNRIVAEGILEIQYIHVRDGTVSGAFGTNGFDKLKDGNGISDSEAVGNFFKDNRTTLKKELDLFLDKIGLIKQNP